MIIETYIEDIDSDTETELNLGNGRRISMNHQHLKITYNIDCHCEVGFWVNKKDLKRILKFFQDIKLED